MIALLALLLGLFAWSGPPWALPFCLFYIWILLRASTSPLSLFTAVLAYTLGSSFLFFVATLGHSSPTSTLLALWLGVSFGYGVIAAALLKFLRYPQLVVFLFLGLLCFPPLGLVCVTHPFIGLAGVGGGLWGFTLALIALTTCSFWRTKAVFLFCLVVVGKTLFLQAEQTPKTWNAQNTHLQRKTVFDLQQSYFTNTELVSLNNRSRPPVVLPEFVGGTFHAGFKDLWHDVPGPLLIGAKGLSQSNEQNLVVLVKDGSVHPIYSQRYPIPVVMAGFESSTSSRVVTIAEKRVALFLCYEMLLMPALLEALIEEPNELVGLSFTSWARNSSIRNAQNNVINLWGQLLNAPVAVAHNY